MVWEVPETCIFVKFMKFPQKGFHAKVDFGVKPWFSCKNHFSLKMMKFPLISAYYSKLSWEMEKWVISARKKVNSTRSFQFSLEISRILKNFMEFHVKTRISLKSTPQNLPFRQGIVMFLLTFRFFSAKRNVHRFHGINVVLPKFHYFHLNFTKSW